MKKFFKNWVLPLGVIIAISVAVDVFSSGAKQIHGWHICSSKAQTQLVKPPV